MPLGQCGLEVRSSYCSLARCLSDKSIPDLLVLIFRTQIEQSLWNCRPLVALHCAVSAYQFVQMQLGFRGWAFGVYSFLLNKYCTETAFRGVYIIVRVIIGASNPIRHMSGK